MEDNQRTQGSEWQKGEAKSEPALVAIQSELENFNSRLICIKIQVH
jgi:hypothetical protein